MRSKRGQGDGPDLLLGHLAVMLEEMVRQSAGQRQQSRTALRHDLQRHHVEPCDIRGNRITGCQRAHALMRASQGLEHVQDTAAAPTGNKPLGQQTGGRFIGTQDHQASPRLDQRHEARQWATAQGSVAGILPAPTQTRASKGKAGSSRQNIERLTSETLHDQAADTEAERVSRSENHDPPTPMRLDPVQGLRIGSRPRNESPRVMPLDQREMPPAPHDQIRFSDCPLR